jgi:hypothetical protein
MAHYDPETLIVLRAVLDETWAALPEGSKSESLKSEMAQHILKQAADGVRDPAKLRASALAIAPTAPPTFKANARPQKRPRTVHNATFDERIATEVRRLEQKARTMAPGHDRDMLLRKARQTKTAAHINEWLSSPGLMSPK